MGCCQYGWHLFAIREGTCFIQEDNSLGLGSLLTVRRLDIQDDFIVRSDDMDVGDDEEDIRSTDFSDNLVLSVVRPGEVSAVL